MQKLCLRSAPSFRLLLETSSLGTFASDAVLPRNISFQLLECNCIILVSGSRHGWLKRKVNLHRPSLLISPSFPFLFKMEVPLKQQHFSIK